MIDLVAEGGKVLAADDAPALPVKESRDTSRLTRNPATERTKVKSEDLAAQVLSGVAHGIYLRIPGQAGEQRESFPHPEILKT